MKKPTTLLAILPVLLLLAAPAAHADRRDSYHVKKKLLRLADQVADGARDVYRSASSRHDRYGRSGRGGYPGYPGSRGHRSRGAHHQDYSLRLLYDLEHKARAFEQALHYRPSLHQTHREYEALTRAFERAAEALSRTRPSHAVERDFDCLAEYMYSMSGYYEEYAFPRRVKRRGYENRSRNRVEVYAPRWNVDLEWPRRGWRTDDEDSDSY